MHYTNKNEGVVHDRDQSPLKNDFVRKIFPFHFLGLSTNEFKIKHDRQGVIDS